MTLPTIDQARSWRGLTLVATDDEPVGRIEAIYVDRTSKQPEWALVHTGLFGSSRTFVPLADAAQRGDVVRVPHETSVVREAPRLEQDAELSEEDEARLYAHYGIQYTTDESSSGLPVGETASPDGGSGAAAAEVTSELAASSRLEADAPAAAGVASATSPTATTPAAGTSWSGGVTGTAPGDSQGPGGSRRGPAAAAGIGAVALAAGAAGVTVLRRRRRKPPSLGEKVGQVSRETIDTLTRTAEDILRQAADTGGKGAQKAATTSRRASRKARRAGHEASGTGREFVQAALAAGLAAAEGSRQATRKATRTGHAQGLGRRDRRGRGRSAGGEAGARGGGGRGRLGRGDGRVQAPGAQAGAGA